MSPTEDDLRAALAKGPDDRGDVVDSNRIIAVAREHRARRRTRLLSAAATVVVVGGVATGIGFLAHNNDQGSGSAGSAGSAGEPQDAGGARGSAAGAASAAGNAQSQATSCPSGVPPMTLQPSSNSTSGPLFTDPVAVVTVCAYAAGSTTSDPARTELTGAAARTFASSLENASKTRPGGLCSDLRNADQLTLAIIASTADGKTLPTVVTTINEPACAVIVSNGSVLRFGWTWPQSLRRQLVRLVNQPAVATGSGAGAATTGPVPAPGSMHGSPLH